MTRQITTLRSVCFCMMRFPRCPPVNLNMHPLTVYNQMDAVVICIMESDEVKFFTLNYMIEISKQDAVSWEEYPEVLVRRADRHVLGICFFFLRGQTA